MSDPVVFDVDDVISRLLAVRGSSAPDSQVELAESVIQELCSKAKEIFLSQPTLLELEAPLTVYGDIHGQFDDLLRWFECSGFPPEANYLILGDFVDRGPRSLEVACLLLAYQIKYPGKFHILRGAHECASVSKIYGFCDELKSRFGEEQGTKLWEVFINCFDCLPAAAIVGGKIFCCHGGLSPHLDNMDQIRQIVRPLDVPHEGLLTDLLWSDPNSEKKGWNESPRGVSVTFGEDIVEEFLKKHNMELIVRTHMLVDRGYEYFAQRKLATIFSATNYCKSMNNDGAILHIGAKNNISFHVLQPCRK